MPRPESVRAFAPPVPFQHPYWESPRQRHRREPESIAAYIAACDARRAMRPTGRVLEIVR